MPEGQFIAVAGQIQPRVWKQVGRDGRGQVGLQIADAGADLDDTPRDSWINEGQDAAIEARVDGSAAGVWPPRRAGCARSPPGAA